MFVFFRSHVQSNVREVYLKEILVRDYYVGRVVFDLGEVPACVPLDSPLATPWTGTQDDDAFPAGGVAL